MYVTVLNLIISKKSNRTDTYITNFPQISQNPSKQFQQLNEIGMDIIFEEKVSGETKDREQLKKMLEDLREGDNIYVTDLTRITCSTQDLFVLI